MNVITKCALLLASLMVWMCGFFIVALLDSVAPSMVIAMLGYFVGCAAMVPVSIAIKGGK